MEKVGEVVTKTYVRLRPKNSIIETGKGTKRNRACVSVKLVTISK